MFEGVAAEAAVSKLTAAVDDLLAVQWSSLTSGDEVQIGIALERQRRRLAAVDHALVGDLDGRGAGAERGCRDTAALLRLSWRLSPGEASARVRAARACGPRRTLDGQVLEPLRPVLAAAARVGEVSVEQAALIRRTLEALPDAVPATAVDDAEQILVGHAARFEPRQLAVIARRLVDTMDPDGTLADDAEQHRRRELRLCQRSDGCFDLHGRLTSECGVIWQTILTAVAAPGGDGADSGTSSVPVTTPQRLHDGFWQAGKRLLNSSLPAAGGVPTTILLTMSIDQLENRTGVVTSAHGGTLTVEQAVRLGVDANVIPVIFTDTGGIHSYGRKRRFATVGQTYAMYARDLRCTFPGCDQPAALV